MTEHMREEFEADAKPYGFDMTRYRTLCTTGEPWNEYVSLDTGYKVGWLASRM